MAAHIRAILRHDLEDLKLVIESSGLFPPEMLDEMISGYFVNPDSHEIWLTALYNDKPAAIAYCAPERLTDGTYNLYLIAVQKELQGKGIGAQLMQHVEELLRTSGRRILLVETSGLPVFELTRAFYDKCGYHREAVIRDFYSEGEDKVVFWKKLN